MERKTFRISFFLRKSRLSKTGMMPIFVRVSTSGLRQDFYIQCMVKPELWDQKKERATGRDKYSYQVNAYLDDYRARVVEVHRELLREGFEGNAIEIKNRMRNPGTSTKMFLAELATYADKRQKEVGVRITQLTANKYHRILRYLREYTKLEYKQEDILLSAINHSYIDGFNTFVQTAHDCKHNEAINLLCCLKNFTRYCLNNEWIEKDPFKNYKLKEEHNKAKDHLTKSEIDILIAKQMPNRRLEAVRDVFAFCCLTGMAFTDADHLGKEHLTRDEKGNLWIHKPREKTSVMSAIPLLKYPLEILNKYAYDSACLQHGKLLPVPSNQKMNAYLKEIATICNIDKNLTTHCARHTFACVALDLGMSMDVIAKVLGHRNVAMTRHYAKISESKIGNEMAMIGEAFQPVV